MVVELKQETVRLLFRQFGSTGTPPVVYPFMTYRWLIQRIDLDEIDMLVAEGVLTEYEETRSLLVDGDLEIMLFTHHYSGRLCYHTENDGLMYARRDEILRYRLNIRCLLDLLYRLLELPEYCSPMERIPRVLWEMGQIDVPGGIASVWFCSALAPNYEAVCAALEEFQGSGQGMLLTGQTVAEPYQRLPGIKSVKVIDHLIDPWSETAQLRMVLVTDAFTRLSSFLMDESTIFRQLILKRGRWHLSTQVPASHVFTGLPYRAMVFQCIC